ncbi:ABC-type Mn2+/Zn2+ transport system, permease component [Schinkia azotoformans MEV2011]|uniref:ABC-type Mn2+/Zn2+ transport system, permease component n=1 Tax=Schinkia azotoformans MEV2011 TaxID=1348973 RepID=A0A072NPT2_SCHAZ|nr:metal ABC transporter permease [Schinkia azotoformans]KEF38928.1 ABC-type Mn2+/Zn2+ transport system, permease component [Schinkia azotoformans MEV2011]MEC1694507.1 metal ABC transporter permease [Schinkia azotoformans]MEC1714546.1 metal ABC transporter permease [Schinkia azotoformans]MEC1723317.1 metal ABC transporter permease [Schinkia azotoformans]MEC1740360.1 metal ABC transporter permease [Schinkia azotoformans]
MISSLLQYEFLQNAFFTGIMIGLIAPLIGVFIVVRRLSLIADALSHITLAGIAASMLIEKKISSVQGLNPMYMGMLFSVFGALFIEKLRKVYKHYEELAIPIILSGGVGLSVVFISLANGFNTDLFSFLFGSVTAVSRLDVWTILTVTIVVVLAIYLFFKELFVLSFDEEHAAVSGVNAKSIHFLFIIMVALVIAASMRIVGVLLVSALMTLPVAASIRIARGFKQTLIFSIIFGELAVIGGLIAAYYLDIAPGGTIVIFSILILIAAIYWKKLKLSFGKKLQGVE